VGSYRHLRISYCLSLQRSVICDITWHYKSEEHNPNFHLFFKLSEHVLKLVLYENLLKLQKARKGAAGGDIALEARRSPVRFPMVALDSSLTESFQPYYGPVVDSASNRNEYQESALESKDGRCVGLTNLPPSCASCLEIWEPQPPGTLMACPGLYRNCFICYLKL
jgi:hypothetical protein